MAGSDPTRGQSAPELQRQLELERRGADFLVLRDGDGGLVIRPLDADRVLIGRSPSADVPIAWDPQVSGLHAELTRMAGRWVLADDGLSRNGSFVGDERVSARRPLVDRDLIVIGETSILFRSPPGAERESTVAAASGERAELSPAQRRVLIALCRPYATGEPFAAPASNGAIAAELVVSVDAVKSHMRALFELFGLSELPQGEKRPRLVELAMRSGTVTPRELLDRQS